MSMLATRGQRGAWPWSVLGALLLALGLPACAVTQHQVYPSAPIRSAQGDADAELTWLMENDVGVLAAVRVRAAKGSKLVRAALVQPLAPHDACPSDQNGCDELDPRFTTGTTAGVHGYGPDYVLIFPRYAGLAQLAGRPRVLLDVESGGTHRAVELDLSNVTFSGGNWGMSGAIRYRPPAVVHPRLGHAVTLSLGGERWLGRTRLHLGYEIGIAGCRAASAPDEASCPKKSRTWLYGGVLDATHDFRLNQAVTLGIGLGYGVLRLATDESSPIESSWRHGPRLSLQFLRTPLAVRRFADEPPKQATAPALSLELLFRDRFVAPRLVPSVAWTYGVAF